MKYYDKEVTILILTALVIKTINIYKIGHKSGRWTLSLVHTRTLRYFQEINSK